MSQSQGVQQKLEQLKAYIPFVVRMISKLESKTNHDKGEHLDKLRGLHKFLTNPDSRRQNIQMLERMEKIIKGMYKSVGKPSLTPRTPVEENRVCEDDRRKASKERLSADSHSSSSYRKLDKRDDRSKTDRPSSHRDHHHRYYSSNNSSSRSRDGRERRSRSRDRYRPSYDRDDRRRNSSRDDHGHRSSSRDGADDHFKAKDPLRSAQTKLGSEKEFRIQHSTREKDSSSMSAAKIRERELFGDDEEFKREPASTSSLPSSSRCPSFMPSFRKDAVKSSIGRTLKHSLLDLPMPPLQKEPLGRVDSRLYSDGVDSKAKGSSPKPHTTPPVPPSNSSKVDLLKKKIGLLDDSSKPKYNFTNLKLNETSEKLKELNTAPFLPKHEQSPKEPSCHSDPQRRPPRPPLPTPLPSQKMPAAPPMLPPVSRSPLVGLPQPITTSLRPTDIPLPSYPLFPPQSVDTPESPDREASFSPHEPDEDDSKKIPLEKNAPPSLSNSSPLAQVNMEAIQKALNFINAHDKSKKNEHHKVSYRYEDFIGPVTTGAVSTTTNTTSKIDYYNPEETWENVALKDSFRNMDEDLRKKDIDLRQISAPYQSCHPPPSSSSQFPIQNKRSFPPLPPPPPNFPTINTTPSSSTNTSCANSDWFSSFDNRCNIPSQSVKDAKDIDLRTLLATGASHENSSSSSNKISSVRPLGPSDSSNLNSSVIKSISTKTEQIKLDSGSKKPEVSKFDSIRTRVAHDQDKLIKLGQKGVAASQLETYKQKREKYLTTPTKSMPPKGQMTLSESHTNVPTVNKSGSQSLLDTLLPEKSYDSKIKDNPSIRKDDNPDSKELSSPRNPLLSLKPSNKELLAKDTNRLDIRPKSKVSGGDALASHSDTGPLKNKDIPVSKMLKSESFMHQVPSLNRDSLLPIASRETSCNKSSFLPRSKSLDNSTQKFSNTLNSKISKDPRHENLSTREPRGDMRDPRSELVRIPRVDNHPRDHKLDTPRDPRSENLRVPRADHPPRDPRPDAPLRDPRSDKWGSRDPRSDLLKEQRNSNSPFIPIRRDPRLNQNEYPNDPRGNMYSHSFPRDPRVGLLRDPPKKFHSHPMYNPESGWNPIRPGMRPNFPSMPPTVASVAPIPVVSVPPTHFKPGPSPKNSAIGQTFTCIMMQGLPHYANSSHIYRFFEEYLLSDICIELDQSYNCKGTAYIHFPTHTSAKTALEKESGRFMHNYKIYLRICSLGILNQAKRTHDLQNIDREKYLNIPPRPRGNGNPFYKKPKTPPPVLKEVAIISPTEQQSSEENGKVVSKEKEEESAKVGYSNLCGVKIEALNSKGLQSFKIPKLKKATTCEETTSEANMEENMNMKSTLVEEKETAASTESDSDDLAPPPTHTKKNRRYRKIVRHVDSDSDEDKLANFVSIKHAKPKKQRGRPRLKNKDSEADDSVINKSVTASAASDLQSDVSDEVPPRSRLQVKDTEIDSYQKMKTTTLSTSTRGRKKNMKVLITSRPGLKKAPKFKIKGDGTHSKTKVVRKGQKTKSGSLFGIEKTKITRQKHEILSPKKKLQVKIPTPLKLIFCLVTEDKLPRRGRGRRPRVQALANSPVPSETSSNTSVFPDWNEALSSQESDAGCSFKPSETLSNPDMEKEYSRSISDLESGPIEFKSLPNKILHAGPSFEKLKRQRRVRNPWHKGYLRLDIPLPHINPAQRKRCYSPPLQYYHGKSLAKKSSDSYLNQCEDSHVDVVPVSVFDPGIMDDTEMTDLTQITPTITDKEMSIFTELPDLSAIEGVIESHTDSSQKHVSNSFLSEEAKEKRIKMISDDLVELASKFTENKSLQKSTHAMADVEDEANDVGEQKPVVSDDDENSLSSKVNQLVASLDESFSSSTDTTNPICSGNVSLLVKATLSNSSNSTMITSSGEHIDFSANVSSKESWVLPGKNKLNCSLNKTSNTKTSTIPSESGNLDAISISAEENEIIPMSKASVPQVALTGIFSEENSHSQPPESYSLSSGLEKTSPGPNYPNLKYIPLTTKSPTESKPQANDNEVLFDAATDNNYICSKVTQEDARNLVSQTEKEATVLEENSLRPNIELDNALISDHSSTDLTVSSDQSLNKYKDEATLSSNYALDTATETSKDSQVLFEDKQIPDPGTHATLARVNISESDKFVADSKLASINNPRITSDINFQGPVSNSLVQRKGVFEASSTTCEIRLDESSCDPNDANPFMQNKVGKCSLEMISSSVGDASADSDLDDGASLDLASMSSFADDTSVVSNDGRETGTPDPPTQGTGKRSSRRDKDKIPFASGLIERRRITRGSIVIPQVDETILWDDGGIVDLFQCDQCDYVGKQRVSHLVNFHTDREVPCEFRKEDYNPVLRDCLGQTYSVKEVTKLNVDWLPKMMIFDKEIKCRIKGCDYNTNSRFDFFYHILEHKPKAVGSVFHCRLCNFMSADLTQFYDHVSSHTGEYRHTCARCGQKAFCIEALIYHHKDYHGSQSQEFTTEDMILEDGFPYIHVCRACHHVHISLDQIETHIQNKHNGKVEYVKANMSRHIVLHSDKKKESELSTSGKRKDPDFVESPKPPTKVSKKMAKPATKLPKVAKTKKFKGLKLRKKKKKKLSTALNSPVGKEDSKGIVTGDKDESMEIIFEEKNKLNECTVDDKDELSKAMIDDKDESKGLTVQNKEELKGLMIDGKEDSKGLMIDDKEDSKGLMIHDKEDSKGLMIHDKEDSKGLMIDDKEDSKGLMIDDKEDSNGLMIGNKEDSKGLMIDDKEDSKGLTIDDKEDSKGLTIEDKAESKKVVIEGKDETKVVTINNEEEVHTRVLPEQSASIPVFLGQDKSDETSEKEAEELVNRILLNNYTSRSSVEIKKKISSLDNILKKVDDASSSLPTLEVDINLNPEKEKIQPIATEENSNVSLKRPKEPVKEEEKSVDAKHAPTSNQSDAKELSPFAPALQDNTDQKEPVSASSIELESLSLTPAPKRMKTENGEMRKMPLSGIITRLKTQLAEDDVLTKIKKDEKIAKSPLQQIGYSHDSDSAGDSDSDHLVICEDEEVPVTVTPDISMLHDAKRTLLQVRSLHEICEQSQGLNEGEAKKQEQMMCRLAECSVVGSRNEIGAHGWNCHELYMCIFPYCSFISADPRLFNLHTEQTHKIRKLGCPFGCADTAGVMMSPSELIKHIASEENMDFPRIESYHSLDPKSATQIFNNEAVSGTPSPSRNSPGVHLLHPLLSHIPTTSTSPLPKAHVYMTSKSPKELFEFPGAETLPNRPPTVPLLQLFTEFQSHRIFLLFTSSKAPEVFKCMISSCSFVTDDSGAFESHSNSHIASEYRCCYCFVRITSGKMLVEHILSEHSHCPFQCKYCLYRAYTKVYLGVHLRKFHPEREPRYIKVATVRSEPPPNPAIENFVHPYKCTFDQCTFRSVDTDAFKAHTSSHGSSIRMHCIFCEVVFDIEGLLKHMHVHMMNEYQCPYCLFGEAEREKLLTHLLNCHPGRPGKVLLRRQVSNSTAGGAKSMTAAGSSLLVPPTTTTATCTLSTSTSTTTVASSSLPPHMAEAIPSTMLPTISSAIRTVVSTIAPTMLSPMAAGEIFSQSCLGGTPPNVPSSKSLNEKDQKPIAPILPSTLPAVAPLSTRDITKLEQTGLTGLSLYRCGNEKCEYNCSTQLLLKEHLQVCDFSRDSPQLRCYHCSKNFRHLSGLLDHIKVHGPKRYLCGVEGCDYRGTMSHYFRNHMKQIHHHSGYKIVLKDFSNKNPETQEFIVYPKDVMSNFKEPHKKRRNEYGVDDLDKIPRTHVAYQELKCYHCMYASKVRLNLIKHLQLHRKYPSGIPTTDSLQEMVKSIPSKQPINPVPRLERKELMFDKMMNLAGSSFEDKKRSEENDLRLKNPIPQKELESLPGFVPDEQLNSCGIDGCKYLSCDEMMLKCHIRTLHSDVENFTCSHCMDTILSLDKIGAHLRLHGDTLYRCGWCSFITPRKALVERHLTEVHPSKTPFDFCIRSSDKEKDDSSFKEENQVSASTPSTLAQTTQEAQWQCGICPFRSVIQSEMVSHTNIKHAIKSQYKCGYCSVRSSVRTAFDNHFAAKHPDKAFRVLCMYYRLDSDDIEPLVPGGGNSTSHEPLWRRNDPERRKQIRGIYLEDDDGDQEHLGVLGIQPGEPKGEEFVCPKCHSFKTPCISTFRSHLCKEANYQRFECAECGITNSLLPTLRRHYTKTHCSQFSSDCYITLPVENTLESWVESIISHQQHLIKVWKETGGVSASPSKGGSRRTSLYSDVEEVSGVILHDSGSDKSKYTCTMCGVECRSGSGLKSHTTAMHQTRFKCQLCPFSSNMELAIQNHRALKHPKHDGQENAKNSSKPFGAQEGEVPSASEEDKNGATEKKPSKHNCPHCNFKTNTARAYYAHVQTHVRFRSYQCEYCQKRFENQRDGSRHTYWRHPSMVPKIIYAPVVQSDDETEPADGINQAGDEVSSEGDAKNVNTAETGAQPTIVSYSCCHCSLKGTYSFVEEHLKAQHRDLPFLLRKEEGRRLHLEMYKYRCGHCQKDSDSLMEAMDHWVKNHVTLDFKFSLSLFSSQVIKSEFDAEAQESTSGSLSISEGLTAKSAPSISKLSKKGVKASKPDSSSTPGPSDMGDENPEDELADSMSSDVLEGGTDSELETNKVTSSTTEENDLLVRCGYCRRVSKSRSDIFEHIRTVHPEKPMKVNLYPKGEYDRLFRGIFECNLCSERGSAPEMSQHLKVSHPGTQAKLNRVIRAAQKDKVCYRCDICAHVVKAKSSIRAHMKRVHPASTSAFTLMQSESNLLLSAKQPIKCNYCGDTSATIEEMESHHTFLHSHLPVSYINIREQALLSIHKSSSSTQKELGASPFPSESFLPNSPNTLVSASPPIQASGSLIMKNTARKSFTSRVAPKRQIATKSTSGRLQLVRLRRVKKEENSDQLLGESPSAKPVSASKTGIPTFDSLLSAGSSSDPTMSLFPVSKSELEQDSLNLNEIFATVNLLGSTPTRLSVTQLAALVNLNPRIKLNDIKESTVAALI